MSFMEQMKSEKFGPLAIPGSDRIGSDRIGSDRFLPFLPKGDYRCERSEAEL